MASIPPATGPTAFVLAGGGTKGSFEVGVLQYLVGVEGIVPDLITATSAGAIAATVLSQARGRDEFADRVAELERDVLAWTRTDQIFGKQPWLGALDGTRLGREIHQELTEGTRPPFPLTPSTVLAGNDANAGSGTVPPCTPDRRARRQSRKARRRRQRHILRLLAGAGFRFPRVRRQLRSSGSSVLNLDPLADALRHGSEDGVRAIDPTLVARPGLRLRLAVTALRAGVLRFVTEDGIIVEADGQTPATGPAGGPVDLVDAVIASASVPMVFPPHSMADDDYVDGGVVEIVPVRAASTLGATRIIAVVAVPLALPRDERDYADAPAGSIGLRSMAMIGVAERQLSNLNVHLPDGTTLTTIDPVVDVVGLFEIEPGLLRINKDYGWLRAADLLAGTGTGAGGDADGDIRADLAEGTHAIVEARRQAWRLEETLWRAKSAGTTDAGSLALVREQKERIRDLVDRRKQLGFPIPEGCADWWSEYEVHTAERPPWLPSAPSTATGPARRVRPFAPRDS
jgi:NTE family protein